MTMKKEVAEVEELAKKWKETKCNNTFYELYKRFEKRMKDLAKGNNEIFSDYSWTFFVAINEWSPEKNVWFIHYLNICFLNLSKHHKHNEVSKKRNFFNNMIDINGFVNHEEKVKFIDIIPAPIEEVKIEEDEKKKKQKLLQFFNRYYIPDNHKKILKMMYAGYTQVEIGKELGVTQSMVHKHIKNIAKSKYATKLYKVLKEVNL